jgi:hypothetical protein
MQPSFVQTLMNMGCDPLAEHTLCFNFQSSLPFVWIEHGAGYLSSLTDVFVLTQGRLEAAMAGVAQWSVVLLQNTSFHNCQRYVSTFCNAKKLAHSRVNPRSSSCEKDSSGSTDIIPLQGAVIDSPSRKSGRLAVFSIFPLDSPRVFSFRGERDMVNDWIKVLEKQVDVLNGLEHEEVVPSQAAQPTELDTVAVAARTGDDGGHPKSCTQNRSSHNCYLIYVDDNSMSARSGV